MIVRIWEAQVSARRTEEFCERLVGEVLPKIAESEGFIGGQVLRALADDDHRILVITRWEDEASLRAYAGPMWQIRPVWAEGELDFLEHPPTVSHFSSLHAL